MQSSLHISVKSMRQLQNLQERSGFLCPTAVLHGLCKYCSEKGNTSRELTSQMGFDNVGQLELQAQFEEPPQRSIQDSLWCAILQKTQLGNSCEILCEAGHKIVQVTVVLELFHFPHEPNVDRLNVVRDEGVEAVYHEEETRAQNV